MTDNGNPLSDAAVGYAERHGWHIVPNWPRDKVPRLHDWPHAASADPEQIRAWWADTPDANVGVQLGPRSGIIDVECDGTEEEEALVELLGTDLAASVPQFRAKRGLHRLFAWSPGLPHPGKSVFWWRGVEFRTGNDDGGAQSVFPPSVHAEGLTYSWVIPADGEALSPLPEEVVAKVAGESVAQDEAAPPEDGDDIKEGHRHKGLLKLAGKMRAWGLAPEEIRAALAEVNRRRCKPPLPDKDLDRLANSMSKYEGGWGLSPPTVVFGRQAPAGPTLPPPADFPTEALPEVLAEFVKQTAHAVGCPTPFVALPVLAAVLGSIGNTRRVRLKKDWEEPAVGWFALLGESGDLKSPAQRAALRFLKRDEARLARENRDAAREYEWERDKYRKERADAVKDGRPMPPEPRCPRKVRALIDDVTIEKVVVMLGDNPRGLLLARDELNGWVGSMTRYNGKDEGGGDLARWLSIHDADPVIYDRKTGDQQTVLVPAAAVSVVGGIQPGVWRRVMTALHYDSGLVARLLLGWVEADPRCWSDAEAPAACVQGYEDLLAGLRAIELRVDADGVPAPAVLGLTPAAHKAWVQFFDGWAERLAASDGVQRAMLSKLKGACARLALAHHVAGRVAARQDSTNPVGKESVAAAITLTDWFADQAERVYGVFGLDEAVRLRGRLCDFIRRRGGSITPRGLHKANRSRYPTVAAAECALAALAREGLGVWLVTAVRGRPSKVFHLAPEPPPAQGEEGPGDS
jgi:hypothetical protein